MDAIGEELTRTETGRGGVCLQFGILLGPPLEGPQNLRRQLS